MKHKLAFFGTLTACVVLFASSAYTKNTLHYKTPQQLKEILKLKIPQEGSSLKKVLEFIDLYKRYGVNTSSKQFFNQLFSAPSPIGILGEIVTAMTQTSMYTFEMAPVATLMEQEVIKKLTKLVGFEKGEGLFVTGGSNANLMALFAARNRIFPNAKQNGLECGGKLVCFVSDQAHYSFRKAANLIGIGMKNVIPVLSDNTGRMNPVALEQEVLKAKNNGQTPFFVAATAGTTVRGAFDPLEKIAAITKKHNLWFHVDGAYGGSVMFSRTHRHLVNGINLADSVTWDFHKVIGIPLICSVILIKKSGTLQKLNSLDDRGYLFHNDDNYNLGHLSLQCGRRVDVLKLWLDWMYHGDDGYEKRVDRLLQLARYAAQKVRQNNKLQLIGPQHYLNVCFQCIPDNFSHVNHEDLESLNDFTIKIHDLLLKSDKSMVNYGTIGERKCIRLVITNPTVTHEDIDTFFDNIQECALTIEESV